MIALIVHGGCGTWLPCAHETAISGCRDAVVKGGEILRYGGCGLDAAIAACVALEDNPIFNSGTGSVLNYDGEAQMDASLMEGHTLRFGAVAAIERVKNPVLVAKKVIEETDHSVLVGAGATAFARQFGFPDYNPRTPERVAEHRVLRARAPQGELRISRFSVGHPEHAYSATTGTVGAVALDSQGNLAAATSTGGIVLKLSGRVGDTPLPGGGTYATAYGAASSTGTGEFVMRILGSRQVCDLIEAGHTAQMAVDRTLERIQMLFAAETGLIAIDHVGNLGVAHRTPEMPHAFFSSDSAITARIRI